MDDTPRRDRLQQLERDLQRTRRGRGRKLLLVAWLALQLIPLAMDNPPVTSEPDWSAAPPGTRALVQAACYDCHSHATDWPWYAKIAPMRVYIWNEVREGRAALNFSAWDAQPVEMDAIIAQVENDLMPPWLYTVRHRDARLSPAEKDALIAGLRAVSRLFGKRLMLVFTGCFTPPSAPLPAARGEGENGRDQVPSLFSGRGFRDCPILLGLGAHGQYRKTPSPLRPAGGIPSPIEWARGKNTRYDSPSPTVWERGPGGEGQLPADHPGHKPAFIPGSACLLADKPV